MKRNRNAIETQSAPSKEGKKDKKEIIKTNTESFALPDWVDPETWEGLKQCRKIKKAANSTKALNLIIEKLERFKGKGFDPKELLETAVERGWTTVFEPKPQSYNGVGQANKQLSLPGRSKYAGITKTIEN